MVSLVRRLARKRQKDSPTIARSPGCTKGNRDQSFSSKLRFEALSWFREALRHTAHML
jgi:hypothetical protein